VLLLEALALAAPTHYTGALLPGGVPVELYVEEGRFVEAAPGGHEVDLDGAYVVPGLIDSHVHLSYWPVADELLDAGVVAAVDLAAPEASLGASSPLTLVASGPMLTAPAGYPTTSWGRGGYGLELRSPEEARHAVDRLHGAGARLMKVPLDHGPTLDEPTLRAAVERAHHHGMVAVAHAMSDASALRAHRAGIDVLAHTPTSPLSEEAVAAWAQPERAVISTLTAFRAGDAAVDNLRRLHEAGARILYGTDLGNRRVAGVDTRELQLLARIGMSPQEVLTACTTLPAEVWGLDHDLAPGRPATFVALPADPHRDPAVLGQARAVYLQGQPR